MASSESGTKFLLSQFREFSSELIRAQELVKSGRWVFSVEPGIPPGGELSRPANPVWQKLLSLLEQQDLTAERIAGEYGYGLYKEAQYVMAALADEIFVHMDWEGNEFWTSNLLESRLFSSHVAGEMFFQKLDRLLASRDPAYRDLAPIYLMALSLGFRGKYWGADDAGHLDAYRRRLFAFIYQKNPSLLEPSKRLFPNAYLYTLEERMGRRLPDVRKWIAALGAAVVVFIAISHWLWTDLASNLEIVSKQILEYRIK